MKRRRRALLWAGGVLSVVVIAGALVLRQPVPYEFMRGARYEGTRIEPLLLLTASTRTESAYRYYSLDRPLEKVIYDAAGEIKSVSAGSLGPHEGHYFVERPGEVVGVWSRAGRTWVYVETEPVLSDRLLAWYSGARGRKPVYP